MNFFNSAAPQSIVTDPDPDLFSGSESFVPDPAILSYFNLLVYEKSVHFCQFLSK